MVFGKFVKRVEAERRSCNCLDEVRLRWLHSVNLLVDCNSRFSSNRIRRRYQQFGKKGLVPWDYVGDIQAVESPRVEKNTTPSLSEAEACLLLHAPDETTVIGIRDHAILFTYFKSACRFAAIANARVGDLERTDSLRKTALNNALEHGAKVEEVQQWAGHADLRTTQTYISYKEKDAETAARRCQIR